MFFLFIILVLDAVTTLTGLSLYYSNVTLLLKENESGSLCACLGKESVREE